MTTGIGEPEALYRAAKARGMNLVTLTDIDTIDGCLEFLNQHPDVDDFVISEEVATRDPRTGRRIHVLLFDISETQHDEIQRLKGNVREMMAYARYESIVASLSPSMHGLPADAWASEEMAEVVRLFDRFEIRNGTLSRSHNRLAARMALQSGGARRPGVTAGSNAHGPARVGCTATISAARDRREFLDDLRGNRTWVSGKEGSVWDASADLLRMVGQEYRSLLEAVGWSRQPGKEVPRPRTVNPLHFLGAPFVRHGLRRVRTDARIRSTRRRLDRMELEQFLKRARSYARAASTAGTVVESITPRSRTAATPARMTGP